MEAVIVTCLFDRLHFLILCRTMGRYLSPCKVAIIINEKLENNFIFLKSWIENVCLKYIPNHEVILLSPDDIEPKINRIKLKNGWMSQQLLKIFYFRKTKSKSYCVLDSKNWFIRPCTIEQVSENRPNKLPPPGIPTMIDYAIYKLKYRSKISYPIKQLKKLTERFIPHETPYLMKKSVIKYMIKFYKNSDDFMAFFKNDKFPSEFMLHAFFDDILNIDDLNYNVNRIHRTIWKIDVINANLPCLDLWNDFLKHEEFLILGIHKSVLKTMSLDDFKEVLKTLDFELDDEIQEILYSNIPYQNVPALK